jgi:hypothetical protein
MACHRVESDGGVASGGRKGGGTPRKGGGTPRKSGGTPRKSLSFTHSTPRRDLTENLIKITKMGTVSVPVPYPITPLKGSQTWF